MNMLILVFRVQLNFRSSSEQIGTSMPLLSECVPSGILAVTSVRFIFTKCSTRLERSFNSRSWSSLSVRVAYNPRLSVPLGTGPGVGTYTLIDVSSTRTCSSCSRFTGEASPSVGHLLQSSALQIHNSQ